MGCSDRRPPTTHVVGAGIAGLAAATLLARQGHAVTLHEAAGTAGGRCRSFVDSSLDCLIDNGNHLLLSGNRETMRYLKTIGTDDMLAGPASACFPFLDLRTGQRWLLRPNAGRLPWWILDSRRRVPDTVFADYLPGLRLALAGSNRTVTECVGNGGVLFERFWEPLAVAALNTPAELGAARLLRPVLGETFARGEAACRPRIARTGLSDTFVTPALGFLGRHGATVRFNSRLRAIGCAGGRVELLEFGHETVALGENDSVILAVPPAAAASLVPGLEAPEESQPIVNAHFRLPEPAGLPDELPFLGLIGGTAQWLFARGTVASITISAANAHVDEPAERIARQTWRDVATALDHDPDVLPQYRVIKERRATFAQTPRNLKRPGTRNRLANLYLAGDWIDTGLPATIESAVRSGVMAARAISTDHPGARGNGHAGAGPA